MEMVWHHTFLSEVRVNPAETQGVVITEVLMNSKQNRERIVEVMFDNFEFHNMYLASQAVMSLYAYGRLTGLVVDSGEGVTHSVPVLEGFPIPNAIYKSEIAGREITSYTQKLLLENSHSFTTTTELDIVKDIKEKLCYVAQEFEVEKAVADSSSEKDQAYMLPDKSEVIVKGHVRMQVPELLFKPELNGKNCDPIHSLAWKSISATDVGIQQ